MSSNKTKMKNYIKDIVDWLFHHDVEDEQLRRRVWRRLVMAGEDTSVEEALKSVWDNLETHDMDTDDAYRQTAAALGFEQPRAKTVSLRWLRIAAALIPFVFILGGTIYYLNRTTSADHLMAQVEMVQQTANFGEHLSVVLPDGSKVRLNGGSVLFYPSRFVGGKRQVYLSGEAYFDVVHDDRCPFEVATQHMSVRDIGTSFTVTSWPGDVVVETVLETGSVEIALKNETGKPSQLKPGQRFGYQPATGETVVDEVDVQAYIDSRQGLLTLDDVTLSEALRRIERHFGIRIAVTNHHYDNQRITVHFVQNESLPSVMDILKSLVPGLSYVVADGTVRIY
jgi:ferric-dicitrate binding protein FerR (iron transport regulator)